MLEAILFDFDGTIADTAACIVVTMREAFGEFGLREPEDGAIRQTIGLPLAQAAALLGGLTAEKAEEVAAAYRRIFPKHATSYITIFPEVVDALEAFRKMGIRMAICTSRNSNSLNPLLEHNALTGYFETSVTSTDGLAPKPAPDMVLALLERMNLKAEDAMVVGDTTYDIAMGRDALCRTCAVTHGNHSREQLLTASPTYVVDRFSELVRIVEGL